MTTPHRNTTLTADDAAIECCAAVGATFSGLFGTLERWREAVSAVAWPENGPTTAVLDPVVESLVARELSYPTATVIGAGFVARPGFLSDAPWHIAWWLGEGNTLGVDRHGAGPQTRRLDADLDPLSESFRDYTTMEWWRVPERTGAPHITGPYVDYLCTDDYTLTLTTPVLVAGSLAGMVGVDIYVRRIEAIAMPHLLRAGPAATLVNSSGRVVASTDPHRAAGSIMRVAGLREYLHERAEPVGGIRPPAILRDGDVVHDCPGTMLALLVRRP